MAEEYQNKTFSEAESFLESCEKHVFRECKFQSVDLTDRVFERCVFELCSLFDTAFDSCKMTGSVFYEIDCTCFSIIGGDWSFTDVRELDFYKMKLCGVNFDHADFTGCCLDQAVFQDCNLSHIKVGNTSAVGTDFRSSTMDGIDFRGIQMKKTKIDLTQAILIASCMGAECI